MVDVPLPAVPTFKHDDRGPPVDDVRGLDLGEPLLQLGPIVVVIAIVVAAGFVIAELDHAAAPGTTTRATSVGVSAV